MGDWTIRRADERDVPGLTQCIDAAYAAYRSRIPDLPAVSDGIAGHIADDCVWLAEADGMIVGGLVLMFEPGVARLANVAVDPRWAGRGIGGHLIALAQTQATGMGVEEMHLTTHVAMPENVSLYTRLGWRETGRAGNKVHMVKGL